MNPIATIALPLSLAALGCARSAPPKTVGEAEHVYRLELSLLSTEPGKPPARSSYTMNVDENGHAELRVGANVPIGANTRQDVGLLLRAHARPSGDALLLDTTTELSQSEADGAIRKLAMRSEVLASPGVEAEAASLEDPVSHRRTTVRVSATRLR
jgi:hypothetical protein